MSSARSSCAALAILIAALVAVAGPAGAQQEVRQPQPCTTSGHSFYDTIADNNKLDGDDDDDDVNLDLQRGWFAYDASKGDKAVTANVFVANMSDRLSVGSTGVAWTFIYTVGQDSHRFVRRLRDFSGEYYEYGTATADGTTSGNLQYEGRTEGRTFPGRGGGVSIVVPKAAGAELGKELSEPLAITTANKQGPGAAQPLSRGVSTTIDVGHDGARVGHAGFRWKVGPCPPEENFSNEQSTEPPPPAPMEPTRLPPQQSQAQPQPAPADSGQEPASGPLPVDVLTKRVSRLKKRRTLVLEVQASEMVTGLAAQLRRGTRVVAKGRLARLDGNAELKLRLTRRLRRGSYVLDLAGSDARGAHRFTQAWLKVR